MVGTTHDASNSISPQHCTDGATHARPSTLGKIPRSQRQQKRVAAVAERLSRMHVVPLTIRHAQVEDADRIGAIQVRAWQATYRGVMPDAYLDELDLDDRAAFWRGQVLALQPAQRLKVIVDDRVVVGFAAAGPEHDGRAADIGQLYAINLDPQVWGRGLGRALLRDVTAELAGLGHREAVLWVVPQNDRARRFYESEQWHDDDVRRDDEVFGVVVPEMRYRRRLPTSGPGAPHSVR